MGALVALPDPVPVRPAERARALTALAGARLVTALTRRRPRTLRAVLTLLSQRARPAPLTSAERASAVIATLSPRCAGGHHCLDRANAIALYLRMYGQWPTWRSGVRYPPLASHAWIEAEGRPVGELADIPADYTPTITISARTPT